MRFPAPPRPIAGVSAISFDFYNTLATHVQDRGRGNRLREYFEANGWTSEEWASNILGDVFARHGREYDPTSSAQQHQEFCERVAATLFRRMAVDVPPALARAHSLELWKLVGPDTLVVFPDVVPALTRLKAAGYRLVVTSNWHCGLGGFCRAMGLGDLLDDVLVSDEVGSAKPDRAIFEELQRRLGLDAAEILHVGDTFTDDWEGARNAGLQALLIDREHETTDSAAEVIGDLLQLQRLLL